MEESITTPSSILRLVVDAAQVTKAPPPPPEDDVDQVVVNTLLHSDLLRPHPLLGSFLVVPARRAFVQTLCTVGGIEIGNTTRFLVFTSYLRVQDANKLLNSMYNIVRNKTYKQ